MNIHQHYSFTKTILGVYLFIHFNAFTLPYFDELVGKDMLFTPLFNHIPNIIEVQYINQNIMCLQHSLMALCFVFVLSGLIYLPRWLNSLTAALLWYLWICILNRNIFISNPGMPYVGWLLIVFIFEPFMDRRDKINVYFVGWFLMMLGYTVSGLHKLEYSPSWLDGTALIHVFHSPLAQNNIIVDSMLMLPEIMLKCLTWGSLILEITALPLGIFYHTRNLYWFLFLGFHLGILLTINFNDLTFGVLMIHIFVFDYTLLR